MPKQAWFVACILSALLLLGIVGFAHWHRGLELAQLQAQLAEIRAAAATNALQTAELRTALAEARERATQLQQEAEEVTRSQQSLEAEMRRALESRDVTISELQGKLTVNILDRVLFDSGEAALRSEGQEVLRKVAGVLAQYPNRRIHVIGHTDNVPIRATARSRYPSNWELSTARATAAVRFLCEEAGVDPRRLGAVGYGEFRPVADNATPEGRSRNRRIAIVVLSDELAGSDVAPEHDQASPPGPPGASTNSVPPAATAPSAPSDEADAGKAAPAQPGSPR